MPIYEYVCKRCGQFESMQRITDKPLSRCPTCHRKVTKIMSQTSFQLKGSGWYATDYARKDGTSSDRPKDSGGDTTTKSEPAAKSESTSDTKASKASSDSKPSKAKEAAAA